MVRTQIQLSEEQARALKRMALEQGLSVAELIRRSIDSYLNSAQTLRRDKQRERALSVIGIGASGLSDIGTDHDQYLVTRRSEKSAL